MSTNTMSTTQPIKITPITNPTDIATGFDISTHTFGHQTHDAIFSLLNPSWSTPSGRDAAISRWTNWWRTTPSTAQGRPCSVFLKATVSSTDSDPNSTSDSTTTMEKVVGFAIWTQHSHLPSHGVPPQPIDVNATYPSSPSSADARYALQLDSGLHRRRAEVIRQKADEGSLLPCVFALDLCTVHPDYQRRGVAGELVQWGIGEAGRRGREIVRAARGQDAGIGEGVAEGEDGSEVMECVTEASRMGRTVYKRYGFRPEDGEIDYGVDPEFEGRDRPSNVFMRTGRVVA